MLLKTGLLWCFNRTYRHEVLNAYVFELLHQVREITRAWITEYKEEGRTTTRQLRKNTACHVPPAGRKRQKRYC